ncbi:MAG: VCBS repeat-containing protein, partial [Thermoanaerobaculia bacterium]|nr:VCBS repeat-containing protein [Thermoanaerobaculia bacterium]
RLLLAGPTAVGPRRLRTAIIDPTAGDEKPSEAWSLQPGPSSVEESWYLLLDRRPTLVAATLDAETIGLFEKKKLRFFPLVADRTRAGRNPSFEITTESRRWQTLGAYFADRNGDGRDDLVLIQPEGLSGSELVVDLYLGNGNGRFQPRPQRLKLPASSERWHFGADFDGDGRPDFVALEDRRLSVFASATARKNKLFDPKPRWSLEPGPGLDPNAHRFAQPDALDLDADGRPEIILTRAEDRGRGVIVVVGLK